MGTSMELRRLAPGGDTRRARSAAGVLLLLVLGAPSACAQVAGDTHNFGALLGLSFLFYEAQQSGPLPAYNRVRVGAPGTGGWRRDAFLSDGADVGLNLTGGYFDAGDFMKYHLPMTQTFITLGLGGMLHEAAWRTAGQWDILQRHMRWAADYLVRCHYKVDAIVVEVGDTGTDHSFCCRPELFTGIRPTKTSETNGPAANIMGNVASVFSLASIILRRSGAYKDTTFANNLLTRATQLLAAADAKPGAFSTRYAATTWQSEVAMGYLTLCAARWTTQAAQPSACVTAMDRFNTMLTIANLAGSYEWSWANQAFPAAALIQIIAPRVVLSNGAPATTQLTRGQTMVASALARWEDFGRKCATPAVPYRVCYTPGGLAWLASRGSLRYVLNVAYAALLHAKVLDEIRYDLLAPMHRCWARNQTLYALGANPISQSYVVGYTPLGKIPADRPHHRSSVCANDTSSCTYSQFNADTPSRQILYGALLGGPDANDAFINRRTDFATNEPALDFNSGFTNVLAILNYWAVKINAAGCTWASYCSGTCLPGNLQLQTNTRTVATDPKKCVDIIRNIQASGAVTNQWTCGGNQAQQFILQFIRTVTGGSIFRVLSINKRCMAVAGASPATGAAITFNTCGSGLEQEFAFLDVPGGVNIRPMHTNGATCVGVAGGSPASGALLQQEPCVPGAVGQLFTRVARGPV